MQNQVLTDYRVLLSTASPGGRHSGGLKKSKMPGLLLLSISFIFASFSIKPYPDIKNMIVAEYTKFPNIIPIATLDLKSSGIADPIHIMYIWFDPDNQFSKYAPPEYCDNFSFTIQPSGLLKPKFPPSTLSITPKNRVYFEEGHTKFLNQKNSIDPVTLIEFPKEPDWWQDDDTPLNSKKQPMRFICQLDIGKIFNDDCRMFVFYDQHDKTVRYIYQRN